MSTEVGPVFAPVGVLRLSFSHRSSGHLTALCGPGWEWSCVARLARLHAHPAYSYYMEKVNLDAATAHGDLTEPMECGVYRIYGFSIICCVSLRVKHCRAHGQGLHVVCPESNLCHSQAQNSAALLILLLGKLLTESLP